MSSMALANFVGMEHETVAETANGTTYRVYATFDNPTDELVAVYALDTAPWWWVFPRFYQDAVGQFCPNHQPRVFRRFRCNTTAGSPWFRDSNAPVT